MKIELEIESNGKHGEDKPMKPTTFQRKVAQMIAKQIGQKKADEHAMKMAAELEADLEEYRANK
jgi:hypothetical protein